MLFLLAVLLPSLLLASSKLSCYTNLAEKVTDSDSSPCAAYQDACMLRFAEGTNYWIRECVEIKNHNQDALGCKSSTDMNGILITTCYCNTHNCNTDQSHMDKHNDNAHDDGSHDDYDDDDTFVPPVSRTDRDKEMEENERKESSSDNVSNHGEDEDKKSSIKCYMSHKQEISNDDIKECPSESNGCLIYMKENEFYERNCVKLDEYDKLQCEEMNDGAVICYCNTDLCNLETDLGQTGKGEGAQEEEEQEKEEQEPKQPSRDSGSFTCYVSDERAVKDEDIVNCPSGSNACLYYTNNDSFWERRCVDLKEDQLKTWEKCSARSDGTTVCYCEELNCNGNIYDDDDKNDNHGKDEQQQKDEQEKEEENRNDNGSNLRCYSNSEESVKSTDSVECESHHNACLFRMKLSENFWHRSCATINEEHKLECSAYIDGNAVENLLCYCNTDDCNEYPQNAKLGESNKDEFDEPPPSRSGHSGAMNDDDEKKDDRDDGDDRKDDDDKMTTSGPKKEDDTKIDKDSISEKIESFREVLEIFYSKSRYTDSTMDELMSYFDKNKREMCLFSECTNDIGSVLHEATFDDVKIYNKKSKVTKYGNSYFAEIQYVTYNTLSSHRNDDDECNGFITGKYYLHFDAHGLITKWLFVEQETDDIEECLSF